ncbi:hypothetical protein NC652_030894 [Populus alba x Populus x berolinensis]|nr:hypothetical protein NC652_030894 [Populus alba x Populus x berolinensis]
MDTVWLWMESSTIFFLLRQEPSRMGGHQANFELSEKRDEARR